ncbi:unnamed protein product [Adineta steineri]|uniref:Discoidin domain-containing receptor 2 n=1 Tax=Adineta steineri TaxID=433720 RepID=A0A818LBQ6_9BILA|nr:unnamed protein product [Adineta steineri]
MKNIVCLFTLLLSISYTKQLNLETCRYPLGIETGKILDSAFSSSSHVNDSTVASNARIRNEITGWCPFNKISSTTYEYIQIDLVNLTVITLIELQGKFSLTPNEQFADAFQIEYRRDRKQKWIKYKDFSEQYILSGNVNSYIPTIRDILPAIIAQEIRIIPIVTGLIPRHICMRLELYGCPYTGGLMSYTIPQGDKQFFDQTYDGENQNGILKDGLGQLTDGIIAPDDNKQLIDVIQSKDQIECQWIGWKRQSDIKLNFYFDTIRNFTSIHVHTSNLFTHNIYVFHSITISNCNRNLNNSQMEFVILNDYINTNARFIHIYFMNQTNIISDCLNIIFTFNNRSQWILVSEIQFDSIPIDLNKSQFINIKTTFLNNDDDNGVSIVHYWHWLFFALSVLILFIVSLVFVYINWIQTYQQHCKLYKSFHMRDDLKINSSYRAIPQIGCCINNSNTSYLSSISNNDMCHRLIVSTPDSSRSMKSSEYSPITLSTIYQSNVDSYLTAVTNETASLTTNPYFTIDMYTNMIPDSTVATQSTIKSIQGPCGNSIYECLLPLNDLSSIIIPHVNEEQLTVEQLYSTRNGSYGTVYRGYLSFYYVNDKLKSILIKTLTTNDTNQKELFDQEHKLLRHLNHPNLVQFYGYTLQQNYAIIEHSDLNDLHTFLSTTQNISKNIRLYMITQLSNALYYLESQHIIHRDIAARNCLIYRNFKIKLTNTAIISEQFESHYYKINDIQLPIRWMPPECFINNQFTSQSDIWSFGITLWEVMTNCLTLPYSLLSDDEVYQRLHTSVGLQLSKPECLCKELIDLMLECWRPWSERPSFQEIYNYFNKRLYGMNIV